MADVTFRTAQAATSAQEAPQAVDKTPAVSDKGDSTTKLVATYMDATGHPYTAKHYDITNIWQDKKGGFESEVTTIESYIKELVNDDQLDNSIEAADKWYEAAERKAGVSDEDSTTTRLIKLAAWVRMQREIKAAMEWKRNGK